MKKYLSIVKASFQVTIAYPFTTIIQILISFISLVLLMNLWKAVFDGRSTIAGFTWSEMLAYLLIVFIINTDVNSEYRCAKRIIDGSIAMTLIKPVSHEKYTLSEISPSIVFSALVNLFIGVIICISVNAYIPNNVFSVIFFIVSMLNAILIKYLIVYLFSLASFWTHNVYGVLWTRVAIVSFFSGALIPLNFFPDWLRSLSELLPFQAIINIPIQIYMSKITYYEVVWFVILQYIWILFFWLMAKFIFKLGIKRVTIHGG